MDLWCIDFTLSNSNYLAKFCWKHPNQREENPKLVYGLNGGWATVVSHWCIILFQLQALKKEWLEVHQAPAKRHSSVLSLHPYNPLSSYGTQLRLMTRNRPPQQTPIYLVSLPPLPSPTIWKNWICKMKL